MKVYLVMIHDPNKNAWVHSVYSSAEKAIAKVTELNHEFNSSGFWTWADYISEEVL